MYVFMCVCGKLMVSRAIKVIQEAVCRETLIVLIVNKLQGKFNCVLLILCTT